MGKKNRQQQQNRPEMLDLTIKPEDVDLILALLEGAEDLPGIYDDRHQLLFTQHQIFNLRRKMQNFSDRIDDILGVYSATSDMP